VRSGLGDKIAGWALPTSYKSSPSQSLRASVDEVSSQRWTEGSYWVLVVSVESFVKHHLLNYCDHLVIKVLVSELLNSRKYIV